MDRKIREIFLYAVDNQVCCLPFTFIMPHISNHNAVIRIKKLMVFEVLRDKNIGSSAHCILEQKTPRTSADRDFTNIIAQ